MNASPKQSLIRPEAYPNTGTVQEVNLLRPLAILLAILAGIVLVSGGNEPWFAAVLFVSSVGIGTRQIGFPTIDLQLDEGLYNEMIEDLTKR